MASPDLRRLTRAVMRLRAHMQGSGFDMAQNKCDITLWREDPLVILNLVTHENCAQCYGAINEIARIGRFGGVNYGEEDPELVARSPH